MLWISLGCLIFAVLCLAQPLTEQGLIDSATQLHDPQAICDRIEQILTTYLREERAHAAGTLGQRQWEQRRDFLCCRYIDLRRRLTFLAPDEGGSS